MVTNIRLSACRIYLNDFLTSGLYDKTVFKKEGFANGKTLVKNRVSTSKRHQP